MKTNNGLLVLLLTILVAAAHADSRQSYNIPAADLTTVLNRFALEAGVSVFFDPAIAGGQSSPGIQGEYSIEEGFRHILSGTRLLFAEDHENQSITVYDPDAGQGTRDEFILSPIQVRAEATGRAQIYDQANAVSVLTRDDIDRSGPRHASEILQSTAGVFTITNEQNPSVSVDIRGLKDFGRVNMNIDGMRQNFQRSGHGQRNGEMFFDTEFLGEVEIHKGAYAGAGGAGASAGVATFRTLETGDILDIDETLGGRLRLSSGVGKWANGQNPSGSLIIAGRPTQNIDLMLGYSRKDSDEYDPGKSGKAIYWGQNDFYTSSDIVNGTGQEMESWIAKAHWFVNDDMNLKLTAMGTDATYGESSQINTDQAQAYARYQKYCDPDSDSYGQYPNLCSSFTYDGENVYPITSINDTDSRSYAIDLNYNPVSDWINLKAKLYRVSTRNISQNSDDIYRLTTRTSTVGGLLSNTSEFFPGRSQLTLDYGIETFQDHNRPDADSQVLDDNDVDLLAGATPSGKRRLTGLWLSSRWQYQRFTLTPAIRWESYRLWGNTGFYDTDARADSDTYRQRLWQYADINVSRRDNQWLPSLGLAYDLIRTPQQQMQWFANAGLSWRPPQITETLTASTVPGHATPVNTYPNWTLQPEQTRSWEAGFNWQISSSSNPENSLSVKLLHFENHSEDYIVYGLLTATPGFVGTPFLATRSMYVNALNDLTYKGEELQLDFSYAFIYGSLNVTRTGRSFSSYEGYDFNSALLYRPWALGGPEGQDPDTYCPSYALDDCIAAGTLYFPPEPEWTGRLTLGTRLLNRALDIGLMLTGATQTGDYGSVSDNGVTDAAGEKVGLRPYTVLDAYGSYQFSEAFRFGFNLKNITDREYIQAMGDGMVRSYAPGRTLSANMQWDF